MIAPLCANTLSKMTLGISDTFVSYIFNNWPKSGNNLKPVIVAPAMNSFMYEHPITEK